MKFDSFLYVYIYVDIKEKIDFFFFIEWELFFFIKWEFFIVFVYYSYVRGLEIRVDFWDNFS